PPGQHQTADARVDVEVDAARGAARGDVLDRVDGAARVAGCADDGEGDPAARGRDVVERGEQVGGVHRPGARADRHLDEVEAQVGGRLAEGRVRRGGQHQGETCVTAGGARTVAGRLDGEQARLGAARGHRPDDVGAAVQHRPAEGDEVAL